jgi:hypothetical protein
MSAVPPWERERSGKPMLPDARLYTPIDYALRYAAQLHWAVFPLYSIVNGRCDCGKKDCTNPGKHPRTMHGLKDATTDEVQIRKWWGMWPTANIAVATGSRSGIVVLDVDKKPERDGEETLEHLVRTHGAPADTVEQISGSGGHHYFYLAPAATIRNSNDKLGRGIDVRGEDGYIIVEPSSHVSGRSYGWEASSNPLDGVQLAASPAWLDALASVRTNGAAHQVVGDPDVEPLDADKVAEIRAAAAAIPADNRDTWREVGMSIHSIAPTQQGFGLWCEWSQTSEKFDPVDQARVWRSFRSSGITLSTLFSLAKRHGWHDPHGYVPSAEVVGAEPPAPAVEEDEAPPVPAELLNPPGILKTIVEYDLATAAKPQPQLAVQGAIALASAVLGRKYVTDRRNHPALFLCSIAESGEGKEHVKTVIERCLMSAQQDRLINGGYASAQGVISKLIQQPAHLTFIDELGRMLEAAKRTTGAHKTEAITNLIEAFGRCHGVMLDTAKSTKGMSARDAEEQMRRRIHNPSITLMALSSPKAFYESLSDRSVADGFLGRFIIVESTLPRRVSETPLDRPPPTEIRTWIEAVRNRNGGNLAPYVLPPSDQPAPLIPLCIQPLAMDAFKEFESRLVVEMNQLDDEGLSPLLVRSKEIAMRLALVLALAEDPTADTVEIQHARWAIAYVDFYAHQLVRLVRDRVAPNDFLRWQADALRLIKKSAERGMTERELFKLSRVLQSLNDIQFGQVMSKLVGRGEVFFHKFAQAGRGRPRSAWVAGRHHAALNPNSADYADKGLSAEIPNESVSTTAS